MDLPGSQPHFVWRTLVNFIDQCSKRLYRFNATAIRSKIAGGYIIALCVPVVGASIGITVGNYYQARADAMLTQARQEQKLLLDLQINILSNLPAKALSPFTGNPTAFRNASEVLLKRIQAVRSITEKLALSDTASFADRQRVFQDYQVVINSFERYVRQMTKAIQPLTADPKNRLKIDGKIGQLLRSQEFSAFLDFTSTIETLSLEAERELISAVNNRRSAENLRLQIVIASLGIAVLVAALLGSYTSRTISQPIEELATLAQQVTRDANTNLRARVVTVDEVGTLAQSVNQLIEWVENYTSDLKAAQLQLIQTEKMSSLGELVGGLAHEINNPISFIYGNLGYVDRYVNDLIELLQHYQAQNPDNPEFLDEDAIEELEFIVDDLPKLLSSMKSGAERIRELVVSLRNFSRLDEAELKTVDLHEGLDNTLLMLNYRLHHAGLNESIRVVKHYGSLPPLACYPAQLNQVFMNVLDNAIDALSGETIVNPMIKIETKLLGSDHISVSISDNGPGIDPAIQSKIFDPFFTAKPIGQGIGLGLSIAYQIVQQHHGQIMVVSQPGDGTTIQIAIPIAQELPMVAEPVSVAGQPVVNNA